MQTYLLRAFAALLVSVAVIGCGGGGSSTPTSTSNSKPVARIQGASTVSHSGDFVLSGASSSDSDGSIASYLWEQTAGTSVTIQGADSAELTASLADMYGETLTFSLTVTDNDGARSSDSFTVTTNHLPTLAVDAPSRVYASGPVTFNASFSDLEGEVASLDWNQISAEQLLSIVVFDPENGSSSIRFDAPSEAGSLNFEIVVIDSHGATVTEQVSVDVVINTAAQLEVTAPIAGKRYFTDSITVLGSVSDDYDLEQAIVSVSSATDSVSLPVNADGSWATALAIPAGDAAISVFVTDAAGVVSTAPEIHIESRFTFSRGLFTVDQNNSGYAYYVESATPSSIWHVNLADGSRELVFWDQLAQIDILSGIYHDKENDELLLFNTANDINAKAINLSHHGVRQIASISDTATYHESYFHPASNTLYLYNLFDRELFKFELSTGNYELVSSDAKGTGPSFSNDTQIAVDAAGVIYAYAGDDNAMLSVDAVTGDRTVLSYGIESAESLVVDEPRNSLVWVTTDEPKDVLYSMDLDTFLVSTLVTYDDLSQVSQIVVDPTLPQYTLPQFISASHPKSQALSYSFSTGELLVAFSEGVGDGDPLVGYHDYRLTRDGNFVGATDGTLLQIDYSTGNQIELYTRTMSSFGALSHESEAGLMYVAENQAHNIWAFDRTSGYLNLLGDMVVEGESVTASDIALNEAAGVLYYLAYRSSEGNNYLMSMDLTNGDTSLVSGPLTDVQNEFFVDVEPFGEQLLVLGRNQEQYCHYWLSIFDPETLEHQSLINAESNESCDLQIGNKIAVANDLSFAVIARYGQLFRYDFASGALTTIIEHSTTVASNQLGLNSTTDLSISNDDQVVYMMDNTVNGIVGVDITTGDTFIVAK